MSRERTRQIGRIAVWLALLLIAWGGAVWGGQPVPAVQSAASGQPAVSAAESQPSPGQSPVARPGVPTLAPRRPAAGTAVSSPSAPASSKPAEAIASQPKSAPPGESPADTQEKSPQAAAAPARDPLVPVPDAKHRGPVPIEATGFHGVTPGRSTQEEVEKTWGPPKKVVQETSSVMHLYSVAPFSHVEVAYRGAKVASIIIRFDRGFPAERVAEQLDLAKIDPVMVSSEFGEILGQAYPERGVLFSFEPAQDPSKTLKKVTNIILEPINAEPFLLRAETNLESRPEFSLHDLDEALKLQPNNAKAHWLRSRVLSALGEYEKALEAGSAAVRLDPSDARYLAARCQSLAQAGRVTEAIPEAEKALPLSQSRPHVRARVLCLLGDLKASTARPDFKQAYQHHLQAIQVADPLASNRHPAIRIAAKEVLVDAHLGAAHDIAWGDWREKEKALENWLAKAMTFADDLVKAENSTADCRFRVCTRAMAAHVGIRGHLDPASWAKEVVRTGDALINATPEATRKSQLQWELALALYDALQIYQMRSDHPSALRYGEMAVAYMEKSGRQSQSAVSSYLLGRLYFRMGAVYAVGQSNHRAAFTWYEKAVPLLGKSPPPEALNDLGGLGETFVSMGISFWETGHRDKALALTQHGAKLMEEAVQQGAMANSALAVPYGNLASMHRQLGERDKADRFEQMAGKAKPTRIR